MLIYTECCNTICNTQLWKSILNNVLNILEFMIIIAIFKCDCNKKKSPLKFFVELNGGYSFIGKLSFRKIKLTWDHII